MAQKMMVMDLGGYSSKVLAVRFPLTGMGLAGVTEAVCPSALEAKTRRSEQLRQAREALPAKRLTADSVSLVFPADKVLNRTIEMPFTDRSKIDQVLAFELENHVPMASDELVFDYLMLERRKSSAKIFAGVVALKEMEEFREAWTGLNIDPRVVPHQGVALGFLGEMMGTKGETAAFVDIGHRKTVVTVVRNNRFVGSRTILAGGYDLTRALSEELGVEMDEAEREKHQAHLFPAGDAVAVGRVQQIADALLSQLVPLVRDLHQTFKALGEPEKVYIFGGGARLGGIETFVSSRLGLPAVLLYPSHLRVAVPESLNSLQYTSCIACAYSAFRASSHKSINFRQGHFAYVGDLRFLRGRMVYLGMMVPTLLMLSLVPSYLKHKDLVEREAQLALALADVSEQVLGESIEDPDEILSRLTEVPPPDVWTVFPEMTAPEVYWAIWDIITQIDGTPTGEPAEEPIEEAEVGKADDPLGGAGMLPTLDGLGALPGDGEVVEAEPAEPEIPTHKLELYSMTIVSSGRTGSGSGSISFKGYASSVATMELFIARLGQHRCFKSIQRTRQDQLQSSDRLGWSSFTLEIVVSCPAKAESKAEEEKGEALGKGEAGAKGSGSSKGDGSGKGSGASKEETGTKSPSSGMGEAGELGGAAKGGSKAGKASPSDAEEESERKAKEDSNDVPVRTPRKDLLPPGGPGASSAVEGSGDEQESSLAKAEARTRNTAAPVRSALPAKAALGRPSLPEAAGRAATPLKTNAPFVRDGVRKVPQGPPSVGNKLKGRGE